MGKPTITTDEFIKKSNIIHNNKYDYSISVYTKTNNTLKINCPHHGMFIKLARKHLAGQGCQKCSDRQLTTKKFIKKAIKIHGNKYNYSLVNYKSSIKNVIIICNIHGQFEQKCANHLIGKGCKVCGHTKTTNSQKSNTQEFIKKAQKIHNNQYDYSLVEYKKARDKIKIICNKHNLIFEQTPSNHLSGNKCQICSHTCSNLENLWLNILNIPNEYRQFKLKINGRLLKCDGYDPLTKTIYEFYGDFWHGNPLFYNSKDINCVSKKKFGDSYQELLNKEKFIFDNGYKLISIWENEFITKFKSQINLQCMRKRNYSSLIVKPENEENII